jgi:hypothetical protein
MRAAQLGMNAGAHRTLVRRDCDKVEAPPENEGVRFVILSCDGPLRFQRCSSETVPAKRFGVFSFLLKARTDGFSLPAKDIEKT